jgi:23S rRNA pseudouridine2605 synthase
MERKMMAVLHKPKGFVCTASQTEDHRTIYDLLPKEWPRVFYVGRLDKDSEGLLLVTNDGDLAQRLAHPSHKVDKEYVVTLDKPLEQHDRLKLLRGFMIEPGRAKCEEAVFEPPCGARVVLRQGLKRQLRLMFYRLGYEVERLVRVRIGGLRLEDLPPGGWRVLSGKEIDEITNPPGGDNSFKPQGSNRPHERRVGVARRVGPRAASRAS